MPNVRSGGSFSQSLVHEANFADQLPLELYPVREPGRYAVASGFHLVIVV